MTWKSLLHKFADLASNFLMLLVFTLVWEHLEHYSERFLMLVGCNLLRSMTYNLCHSSVHSMFHRVKHLLENHK